MSGYAALMSNGTQSDAIQSFLHRHGVTGEPGRDWEVRRLGTDKAMVDRILEVIERGEKTMTFSLPWVAEHERLPAPAPGRHIVLLDADDAPRLLLRLTDVKPRAFGEVDADDLAREGIPMRDPEAWRDLHTLVWNGKLAPLGLAVSDDMPVWAEYFDLLATA